MTGKIIPFPNAAISEKAKQSMDLEQKKNKTEQDLNFVLNQNNWDLYTLSASDFEMLALYGETMHFDPTVAARLISKLAQFVSVLSKEFCEEPY